jgi:hypothetical protein
MTSQLPSQCFSCAHRDPERTTTCAAFPGGIPDAMLLDAGDHRKQRPGDRGIRFARAPGPAVPAGFEDWLRTFGSS